MLVRIHALVVAILLVAAFGGWGADTARVRASVGVVSGAVYVVASSFEVFAESDADGREDGVTVLVALGGGT